MELPILPAFYGGRVGIALEARSKSSIRAWLCGRTARVVPWPTGNRTHGADSPVAKHVEKQGWQSNDFFY